MPEQPNIAELIRLSDQARQVLASEASALRHRLDVPARVRSSLLKHPTAWFGGSLATGVLAANLFRRKPKPSKKSRKGVLGLLLTLALAAGRPAFKIWLTSQLKSLIDTRLPSRPQPPRSRNLR